MQHGKAPGPMEPLHSSRRKKEALHGVRSNTKARHGPVLSDVEINLEKG